MKIVLIGGQGFLGTATRSSLEEFGLECRSAGRSERNDFYLDLMNPESISEALANYQPDLIVNLAGAFESTEYKSLIVNSEGPKNLIGAIESQLGNSKLIHVSSATEPRDLNYDSFFESKYSESKYIGTKSVFDAVDSGRIQAKIVRVHNCYGKGQPRNRFVSWVIDRMQSNQNVYLNYPNRIRDFCLVSEAANGVASISSKFLTSPSPEMEEVGTGIGISLLDATREVCDVVNADRNLIRVPDTENIDMHISEIARVSEQDDGFCNTEFRLGITKLLKGV